MQQLKSALVLCTAVSEILFELQCFNKTNLILDMETIAVPCDGRVECQGAADEFWLCRQQTSLGYAVLGKN